MRRNGYAIDREEFQPGVFCIGAAIRDHLGAVVGAISASTPTIARKRGAPRRYARGVMAAARALSAEFGEQSRGTPPAEAVAAQVNLNGGQPCTRHAGVKTSKDFPIPDTMKAWVLGDPGRAQLNDKPVPVPKKAEVLVRIDAVAICATDLEVIYARPAGDDPGRPAVQQELDARP